MSAYVLSCPSCEVTGSKMNVKEVVEVDSLNGPGRRQAGGATSATYR